jgi:hypothetical protein
MSINDSSDTVYSLLPKNRMLKNDFSVDLKMR